MKSKRKYWFLLIPGILILYLLWGPLFPWNPLKLDYTKIQSDKAAVYISDMLPADSVVYRIDEILREEEEFHGLEYQNDIKIVILDEESSMKRFLPWLKGSGYSVSLSLADLIYIGPLARKSPNGIGPYLRHELSHMLIDQNTTYDKVQIIHDQGWLAEGIAEYFSGHVFISKAEFFELASEYKFDFTSLHEGNPLRMSLFDTKLKYTYYRLFVEFLVNSYGIERLRTYLKRYIDDPLNYKKHFTDVYSASLNELLEAHYSSFK